MRKLLLTVSGIGLLGFGLAVTNAAVAGPTSDQQSAETFDKNPALYVPPHPVGNSARGEGVIRPNSSANNAADPGNGLAQGRIVGGQQLDQQPPLQQQQSAPNQ